MKIDRISEIRMRKLIGRELNEAKSFHRSQSLLTAGQSGGREIKP